MKIIPYTLILLLTTLSIGNSYGKLPNENSSKISMGITGGGNFTQVIETYSRLVYNTPQPAVGFSGGLFFQYSFSKVSSVYVEALYKSLNLKDKITYTNGMGQITKEENQYLNFRRFALPILYRATLHNFFIDAGFFVGYASAITNKSSVFPFSKSNYVIIQKHKSPFYKGVSAGIGYRFVDSDRFSLAAKLRDDLELTTKNSFDNRNSYRLNSINLSFEFAYKF